MGDSSDESSLFGGDSEEESTLRVSTKERSDYSKSGASSGSVADNSATNSQWTRVFGSRRASHETLGVQNDGGQNEKTLVRRSSGVNAEDAKCKSCPDVFDIVQGFQFAQKLRRRSRESLQEALQTDETQMNKKQHDATTGSANARGTEQRAQEESRSRSQSKSRTESRSQSKSQSERLPKIMESLADSMRSQAKTIIEYLDELMMPTSTEQKPSWINVSFEKRCKLKAKISEGLDTVAYAAGKAACDESSQAIEDKEKCELELKELTEQKNHMQISYLKELSALRPQMDRVVKAAMDNVESNYYVEYYEPMRYLEPELQTVVMSVVDMKLRSIFRHDARCQEKGNQNEVAKLENAMQKSKLEDSEKKVAELQKEFNDCQARYVKQGQLLDRLEWEVRDSKAGRDGAHEQRKALIDAREHIRCLEEEKEQFQARQDELERLVAELSESKIDLQKDLLEKDKVAQPTRTSSKTVPFSEPSLDLESASQSQQTLAETNSCDGAAKTLPDIKPAPDVSPTSPRGPDVANILDLELKSSESQRPSIGPSATIIAARRPSVANIPDMELKSLGSQTPSIGRSSKENQCSVEESPRKDFERERSELEEKLRRAQQEIEKSTTKAGKLGDQLECLQNEADELRKELKAREMDSEVDSLRISNSQLRDELKMAQNAIARRDNAIAQCLSTTTGSHSQDTPQHTLPAVISSSTPPPSAKTSFMTAKYVPPNSPVGDPEQAAPSDMLENEVLQIELAAVRRELEEAQDERTQLEAKLRVLQITRGLQFGADRLVTAERARVMGAKERAEMSTLAQEKDKFLSQKEALRIKANTANGCLEAMKRENLVLEMTCEEIVRRLLAIPDKLFKVLGTVLKMNLSGEAREVISAECRVDFAKLRAMLEGLVDADVERSKLVSARLSQDARLRNSSKEGPRRRSTGALPDLHSGNGSPQTSSVEPVQPKLLSFSPPKLPTANTSNANMALDCPSVLRVHSVESKSRRPSKEKPGHKSPRPTETLACAP